MLTRLVRAQRLAPLASRVLPAVWSWSTRPTRPTCHGRAYITEPRTGASELTGSNAMFLESLFEQYKTDPASLSKEWQDYFAGVDLLPVPRATLPPQGVPFQSDAEMAKIANNLIRAYRFRGALKANLDPLGERPKDKMRLDPEHDIVALEERSDVTNGLLTPPIQELDPRIWGLAEGDLDKIVWLGSDLEANQQPLSMREVIRRLELYYCGTFGVEFMHCFTLREKNWCAEQFERTEPYRFSREEKINIFTDLARATGFEEFLKIKWSSQKRFGVVGCEALIPGLQRLVEVASDSGVETIAFGMSHRGRLNVLGNVLGKKFSAIFADFEQSYDTTYMQGSGDVKYHLGTSQDRTLRNGKKIHLAMAANPSHLEAVDPVVLGKTRAKQFFDNDSDTRARTIGVLIHGDASFAGQGVVHECLAMMDLRGYSTGGTIHVIVNNQIGFTTDPTAGRSSPFPSDVAKTVGAPIFHVNADRVEDVAFVMQKAVEYRQTFKRDVVVDIVCYRRLGHNEGDNPAFTQPREVAKIKVHPPSLDIYKAELIKEGVLTQEGAQSIIDEIKEGYEVELRSAKDSPFQKEEWLAARWAGIYPMTKFSKPRVTGVDKDFLAKMLHALSELPEGFVAHDIIKNRLADLATMAATGEGIDWNAAEALAFGTLTLEEIHVRLAGQDVERGTFSQRHAVVHDQVQYGRTHIPLQALGEKLDLPQARFSIYNSHLSEFGALGFEMGYSLESPQQLVLWEAQFGDFANEAQVMMDQFIAAGEEKWLRQSCITVLLPHGYEGQGPEHSSARLERFLQLSNEPEEIPSPDVRRTMAIQDCNMQVVVPSTPSNLFHVLRRQVNRDFRKPLVVLEPKSLLRSRLARSSLADMDAYTTFQRVYGETNPRVTNVAGKRIRKMLLCSGKVYYDLLTHRESQGIEDVALIRIEQLSPFPFDLVCEQVQKYPKAQVQWVQEEPKNMGGWTYVRPRIECCLEAYFKEKRLSCVSRPQAGSTAVGYAKEHKKQTAELMEAAFE